jgi:antitoxin (DNA-binding transcriptional repressor) of toxin-antitoxin stability system
MTVNVEDAESKLAQLLEQLAPGEEIVLQREGRAIAKLVRLNDIAPRPRLLGSFTGEFTVPDNFDDPLPKEIEDSFYE